MTTLAAMVLGYLVFFKKHQAVVDFRFATVEGGRFTEVVSAEAGSPVADSPYRYVLLDNVQVNELLQKSPNRTNVLHTRQRTVTMWPKAADTTSYSRPRELLLDAESNHTHVDWEAGGLNGFLGVRRAGPFEHLRVDYNVRYQRPDESKLPSSDYGYQQADGKIFYQGPTPDENLVFFAPVGDDYHVVILTTRKKERQ